MNPLYLVSYIYVVNFASDVQIYDAINGTSHTEALFSQVERSWRALDPVVVGMEYQNRKRGTADNPEWEATGVREGR